MSITKYFRNVLAAQMSPRINFKNDSFVKVEPEQIKNGQLAPDNIQKLFDKNNVNQSNQLIPVLIALKTIKSEINNAVKNSTTVDDLTCVFFMPALLNNHGKLIQSQDKNPWFVREFLYPMIDEEICVGKESDVDDFISANIAEKQQIDSWDKNFEYACRMFESVTKSDFYSNEMGGQNLRADGWCYVFYDNTVNASFNIIKLYDKILNSYQSLTLPLYNRFISTASIEKQPIQQNDLSKMKLHCGLMGGEYPLSDSQREALNNLSSINEGEILAVSGPPGTGKTTLLQSVVANLITRHAIEEKDPPIIVASSTNNQAVTNIIDSFGHINTEGIKNLEQRWVTVANSFAVYFPSVSKQKEGENKNYKVAENLILSLNNPKNIAESTNNLLKESREYFSEEMSSVEQCKIEIHKKLCEIESLKNNLLENFNNLLQKNGGKTISEYLCVLSNRINEKKIEIDDIERKILEHNKKIENIQNRITEWINGYKKLTWYIRLFSFVPVYKKHIINWGMKFKNDFELLNFSPINDPKSIIKIYQEDIERIDKELYLDRCRLAEIKQEIINLESESKMIDDSLSEIAKTYDRLITYTKPGDVKSLNLLKKELSKYSLNILNEKLDVSARYVEFWLAVHYYECLWLESAPLSEKQIDTNIFDVQKEKIKKLSMISPCMVMTFFMLPKCFKVWKSNIQVEDYLFNYIDLLIVDEAGQTSPEIAAPSFALAKRAIVVGDEQQIPPVWGINRALDEAIAISNGVIKDREEFKKLIVSGLNSSQSSVMNVALNSCLYKKYDRGLFLSEHRRCYDEIISYCNDLVYKGKLQPLRGAGIEDENRPIDRNKYPIVGYYDISTNYSQRKGTSRVNFEEANEIAKWLKLHLSEIYQMYKSPEKKDILAIITPFHAQANVIRNALKNILDDDYKNIEVGTVHTFQGAERKIIIFSSTYGSAENCQFINYNKNLMNVAVSRAKDAFWVFGSYDCLKNSPENSASSLLAKMIGEHKIEC